MKNLSTAILVLMLAGIMLLSACSAAPPPAQQPVTAPPAATAAPSAPRSEQPSFGSSSAPGAGSYSIGLSAGGAKDIANFRENIRNNYLPLPSDVTYEGLFYDYYFETGAVAPANKLFSPAYHSAVTRDPFSEQTEYYLSIGLNSGLQQSDFQRKKLNLVIVLDNSGSMNEAYNQYYYDGTGKNIDTYAEEGINRLTKMQSAAESVVSILNQLRNDDQVSILTFNSSASLLKPMGLVGRANMRDVKNRVLDITAGGGTSLSAGLDLAARQFNNLREVDGYEYENRIIILTDAQPNTGDYSGSGLLEMTAQNAANRIYTTFIGIGVDFNSQLIEQITKIKGANYYSVHSPGEFRNRVEEEFEYMVTPLVFNLELNFASEGWRIEKVFGSPEANEATGKLMYINTLFASKSENGQTRGGLVLLKLKKTSSAANESITLRTSYEDRNGRIDGDKQVVYLETLQPEYFDNNGIRKGVLLSRYAALLKNWTQDERQNMHLSAPWEPCINDDKGIIIPIEVVFSQWERQSLPLTVSANYSRIFRDFSDYFESEMDAIRDNTLGQELDIINMLSRY
jgi:Ca-activated chloride channel family protein